MLPRAPEVLHRIRLVRIGNPGYCVVMFSQSAEYALRIAVFLGTLRGEPATTKQIAAATLVPEGYLSKILQSLGRAGLVQSRRGLHGGSVLAKPPGEINVYDVVSAISPLPRIKS